jgi:membrane fusion protein, multidrug efflux system
MPRSPLALVAFAALALGGCAARAASITEPEATPVTVATALAPAGRAAYDGPGTVVAQHVYRVAFEVPGRIGAVNVDVGDRVAAGTVLAALDGSDYAAQARGADAQALGASAAAAKARNGARAQERIGADKAVDAARAQLERVLAAQRLAVANAARYDTLYASGDVAAVQHDQTNANRRDADAAVAAAQAQLAQAQAQRNLVHDGARVEDISAANAAAVAARAAADLAHVTLAKSVLTAPAAAYVDQRLVEPGSSAQPGVTAFVLVDARDPDVLVAVPEARMSGIAEGSRATVRIGGRAYRATITRIEPDADPATHTAQVRVHASGLRARTGGIVDVALGAARDGGDATVPLGAIVTDAGSPHVLVYDAARGSASARAVRVVDGDGERAVVTGIAPGTRIVHVGATLIKPGAPLKVVAE